jgi:undecaprenyl-diphosphatase
MVSTADPEAGSRPPRRSAPARGSASATEVEEVDRPGDRGASIGRADEAADSGTPPAVRRRIAAIDAAVDEWFETYRGRPALDAAAKVVAGLSDHGLIWALEAAWRVRRPGPERRRVVRDLAIAGISSSVINAAVKAAVGRARPDRSALDLRAAHVPVREPTSSSFPSGHTLAAFCTATVMADQRHPAASAIRFGAAGLVALSRLHLRAHHASDVVGGLAIGVAVGGVGRLLRR